MGYFSRPVRAGDPASRIFENNFFDDIHPRNWGKYSKSIKNSYKKRFPKYKYYQRKSFTGKHIYHKKQNNPRNYFSQYFY